MRSGEIINKQKVENERDTPQPGIKILEPGISFGSN
jgi:hypothetical protein